MGDMLDTIIPKSDQLNYDDFAGREFIIIKITKVTKKESKDQPISIFYEGDNGKPYKPNKGMRVALINIWGDEKEKFVGKSLKLFGEPTVRWAGKDAGGIRISEASDISKPVTFLLTLSKGIRVQYTVKPLELEKEVIYTLEEMEKLLNQSIDLQALTVTFNSLSKTISGKENLDRLKGVAGERKKLFEGK